MRSLLIIYLFVLIGNGLAHFQTHFFVKMQARPQLPTYTQTERKHSKNVIFWQEGIDLARNSYNNA